MMKPVSKKKTPEERMILRDLFVDNFVTGRIANAEVKEITGRDLSDKFYPAWESVPDIQIDDALTEVMVENMMLEAEDEPASIVSSLKFKMPDCLTDQSKILVTGGMVNISALAMAFASLEVYGVAVSAIVTSSIRIGDFRSWSKEVSPWIPASLEEAESRGVFGKIWTAEVYARNSFYFEGCTDYVYLLACPNKAYPRGLWTTIQVATYGN